MDVNQYLAQYGIDGQTLSPTVKDGINEVLRTAGYTALQQLSKVLSAKVGQISPNSTAEQRQAAEAAAAAEALAAQQQVEADKKAKQQKLIAIAVGLVAVIIAIGGGILYVKRRKTKTNA